MPIDSVRHSIHIRRKKNAVVFNNIDRLKELGRQARSHQDILDGLHPWNANHTLKFDNKLPLLLGILGAILSLAIFISPSNIWAQLCLFAGCSAIFWSYITYEDNEEIQSVTSYLEKTIIAKKYQLEFNRPPPYLGHTTNAHLFTVYLKNLFPIFNRGYHSNNIDSYASTTWIDHQGVEHSVLIFSYSYVTEAIEKQQHGVTVKTTEIEKRLWGAFIFNIDIQGLAVTSISKKFNYPYLHEWQSNYIAANRKIDFFGTSDMHLAKTLTPVLTLKLANFFNHQNGELLFHPDKNVMCFMGAKNLFQISKNDKTVEDISTLRGHLRTFKLPHLEQLQRDLMLFLTKD